MAKSILLEDMILTTDAPTAAGSRMLEGYLSPFEATAVARLRDAGFAIAGKANVGEMGFDVLGETSYFGASLDGTGNVAPAANVALAGSDAPLAAVGLDVNGTQRRGAAVSGQVCIKPTYGTVSRFGTIAIACSGEAVCVTANSGADCQQVLDALAGHDDADGTSLPEATCALVTAAGAAGTGAAELLTGAPAKALPQVKRVGIAAGMVSQADADVQAAVAAAKAVCEAAGIEVFDIDDALLQKAGAAWNILMSAELCNNVSRFDGVKYGYRTENYETIGQLYTNSRTEAFGPALKTALLFGSETLSEENYDRQYDKALRMRRVINENLLELFASCDCIMLPACSKATFAPEDIVASDFAMFTENRFTAPASLTSVPAVVAGGVQLIGPNYADTALLKLADILQDAAAGKEAN